MPWDSATADATCKLMGFGGFVDPTWAEGPGPALRAVLCPSFRDDVGVTVVADSSGDRAQVEVAALIRSTWPGGRTPRYQAFREAMTIPRVEAEALLGDLRAADSESLTPDSSSHRDGMWIAAAWSVGGATSCNEALHNGRDRAGHFAARLFQATYPLARTPAVCCALLGVGLAAGLKVDAPPGSSGSPTNGLDATLLLIGDSWDQDGLREAIDPHVYTYRPRPDMRGRYYNNRRGPRS